MKNIFFVMLIITCSISLSFGCAERVWDTEAKKFLEKESPNGSEIEIQKDGEQFNFSVRHKQAGGQYSKNGNLVVKSDGKGNCEVKIISSQVQSQGDYDLSFKSKPSNVSSIDLVKLSGKWSSGCIQMQNSEHQGHVIETYSFDQKKIQMKRSWYKDQKCIGKTFSTQMENGSFELGKENTNNGFNPSGTYEVKYQMKDGTELGLLWVNKEFSELRLSRGFGSTQNTMLALTQYTKSK